MKVLIATDKPFAKVAVDGIRKEIEAAGYELALLEKYTEKAQLLDAVKDANAIIIRSDIIDAAVLDDFILISNYSTGTIFAKAVGNGKQINVQSACHLADFSDDRVCFL